MPVEYRLTLAGDPPVKAVAARAALDAADLSQFAPWRQVLSAGLYDTRGYSVSENFWLRRIRCGQAWCSPRTHQ